ncbi:MAG: MBL fold metallo-hydrolase [Fervidicoccaceae archaeon]
MEGKKAMFKRKMTFPASDSLGVRSMANFIETEEGIKIAIDPGAALAPRRYGLPPHPIEIEELNSRMKLIGKELEDSDIIIITHFHRDHYPLREDLIDSLKGKKVIMKHPQVDINYSQSIRGSLFLKELKKREIEPIITNGIELKFGSLRVYIDGLFWHGERGSPLGKVATVFIDDDGNTYYFASDSQGPIDIEAMRRICEKSPSLLYISGPPIYLGSTSSESHSIIVGMRNLENMIRSKCFNELIVDHHFAREVGYEYRLKDLHEIGKQHEVVVYDVASYLGIERRPLESMRMKLYNDKKREDHIV